DALGALLGLKAPEGPAIAGWRVRNDRADAVDRARDIAVSQTAIGAHAGAFAVGRDQPVAGMDVAGFDYLSERHARLLPLRAGDGEIFRRRGCDFLQARLGAGDVSLVALDADIVATQALGGSPRGAGAEERVEDGLAGARGGEHDAVQQRLGLLRGVQLATFA